ncbi:helix-turn-helix domain-containing protein [Paenibacillus koleovorans]|uniref:helix-turn-helix domain-containing protein n=1 Tax=Paenibacillus koleovorans TaxID=121608 RepID=UPI000FD85F4F|nr:helix-turn-helix domain-containing protein [Paenibacillus koleovorans]
MRWKEWYKLFSGSLFKRLLFGYAIVIALLLSFHFLSIYSLRGQYQDRLISFNQSNLQFTVKSYENVIQSARDAMIGLYNNAPFAYLAAELETGNADLSAINMKEIVELLIQTVQSNSSLFLENIVVYVKKPSIAITKEGTSDANLIFSKYVGSDYIEPDFWSGQFETSYWNRTVPAYVDSMFTLPHTKQTHTVALIVKNQLAPNFYLVAFINTDKASAALHHAYDNGFWITDAENRIYNMNAEAATGLVLPEPQKQLKHVDSSYYLYQQGQFSGLIYTSRIPGAIIQTEIDRFSWIFLPALLISLLIGIGVSVAMSLSIYNPVKRFVHSLQSAGKQDKESSGIREFQAINEHLQHVANKKKRDDQDLSESKSILRYYTYINKIKAIKEHFPKMINPEFEHNPFVFVLTQLHFRKQSDDYAELDPGRAASYIREFIHLTLIQDFPNSITFQLEKDQIASLVFLGGSGREQLLLSLSKLLRVLELDARYCLATLGVSSMHAQSSKLTTAYEEASELIRYRLMNDTMQIIEARSPRTDFMVSPQQELDLYGSLLAANRKDALQLLQRIMNQLRAEGPFAEDVRAFAHHLLNKAKQALRVMKLDEQLLEPMIRELPFCYSMDDCEDLLTRLLEQTMDRIQARREEQDALVAYVIQYLESHYHEDISLDKVADTMKLTSGHLSAHFKEKSGVNFKDYLTEIRMRKAKEMLKQTDKKIQEISELVGYPNITPFIRMFRKHTGLTPGDYRKGMLDGDS